MCSYKGEFPKLAEQSFWREESERMKGGIIRLYYKRGTTWGRGGKGDSLES